MQSFAVKMGDSDDGMSRSRLDITCEVLEQWKERM
jgi:hypothetical protein